MIFVGVVIFVCAFLVSVLGTYLARRYARRLGLMDDPGHRKVHTVATPRNGGIGIFWGFALPLVVGAALLPILYDAQNIDGALDEIRAGIRSADWFSKAMAVHGPGM